jgi:TonB family protein
MFHNLVESDLHTQEHVRRSWFFLGTLAFYAVLFMIAGVASIYAYDAHLEQQTNEYIVTFVPPIQPDVSQERSRSQPSRPITATHTNGPDSIRTMSVARINESTVAPDKPSAAAPTVPELPPGGAKIGLINADAGPSHGPAGLSNGAGGGNNTGESHVVVDIPDALPPPRVAPTPLPIKVLKVSQVLNGRAVSLPKPAYPQLARLAKVSGMVMVQVLIDETGKVISAQSVSGHPLLRTAAVQAAQQARFSPTVLGEHPVKVSGVITYNFML